MKDGSESDSEYVKSPENSTPSPLKKGKPISLPTTTPVNLNISESDDELEEKAEEENDEQDEGNFGVDENEIVPDVQTEKKRKNTVVALNVPPKKRVSRRSRPICRTR